MRGYETAAVPLMRGRLRYATLLLTPPLAVDIGYVDVGRVQQVYMMHVCDKTGHMSPIRRIMSWTGQTPCAFLCLGWGWMDHVLELQSGI